MSDSPLVLLVTFEFWTLLFANDSKHILRAVYVSFGLEFDEHILLKSHVCANARYVVVKVIGLSLLV